MRRITLTQKELEALQYIAEGHSNPEIAELMSVSPQTVKNRVSIILQKTHTYNRTQAATMYLKGELEEYISEETRKHGVLLQAQRLYQPGTGQ